MAMEKDRMDDPPVDVERVQKNCTDGRISNKRLVCTGVDVETHS